MNGNIRKCSIRAAARRPFYIGVQSPLGEQGREFAQVPSSMDGADVITAGRQAKTTDYNLLSHKGAVADYAYKTLTGDARRHCSLSGRKLISGSRRC